MGAVAERARLGPAEALSRPRRETAVVGEATQRNFPSRSTSTLRSGDSSERRSRRKTARQCSCRGQRAGRSAEGTRSLESRN